MMKKTHLIQRVRRPLPMRRHEDGKLITNPFAFGGGYRDGGFESDAMELMAPIFSFDYMGASEFEHGAVPAAMRKLVEYRDAGDIAFEHLTFPMDDILLSWVRKDVKFNTAKTCSVWVICSEKDKVEILDRVTYLVLYERASRTGKGSKKAHPDIDLKHGFGLGEAMKVVDDYDRARGGLELDNGFFVTCDEEMATKFVGLFRKANQANQVDSDGQAATLDAT